MSLNFKHRLFLHHYLGDAKGDPVKAARLAGYSSPEKAAPVLLRNSTIASYLEQKLEEAGALPVAEILARYSAVATFDILEQKMNARSNINRPGVRVYVHDLERQENRHVADVR